MCKFFTLVTIHTYNVHVHVYSRFGVVQILLSVMGVQVPPEATRFSLEK